MGTLIFKRLMLVIPNLIGVVIITFLLTRALPGDPAAYFAGPAATKEAIERVQALSSASTSRWSCRSPATSTILPMASSAIRSAPGSRWLPKSRTGCRPRPSSRCSGLFCQSSSRCHSAFSPRWKQGSWIDHTCRIVATAGVSLPVFFTGLLLVYVFYFLIGWSPAPLGRLDAFATTPQQITGFYLIDSLLTGKFETFRAALSQLLLPGFTLGIFSLAPIARMTRASMLAVLASDFVRTARASGLDTKTVILTYAFPQCDAAGDHHARHGDKYNLCKNIWRKRILVCKY